MTADTTSQPEITPSTSGAVEAFTPAPASDLESVSGRLTQLVLLAGQVRPTELSRGMDRSLLSLPIAEGVTLLDRWIESAEELARALDVEQLVVRLLVTKQTPPPCVPATSERIRLDVSADASEYRGTGGVLRDASMDESPDSWILVSNALQLSLTPLSRAVSWLAPLMGDAALLADEIRRPLGIRLIRAGVLHDINPVGFIDLKEQALPQIAKAHDVRVAIRPGARSLRLRTLDAYISSLQQLARAGDESASDPLREQWSSAFSLVEPGAEVDPSARLHDSVVLSGGQVGPGALLVRSLVLRGARVPAGEIVRDRVVRLDDAGEGAAS